ncbi:GntR family transcriptional regulator [Burkholderia sp. MR1-5-21]
MKVPSNGKVITKTSETYQALRNAILWGDLPAGSRLRTNVLTKEYDTSLSSLREALSQLTAEGLTQAEAHRGYVVSPISVEDVTDLSRVRIVVETQCLVWAIENGNLEWESNIVAATHRLINSARELDRQQRIDAHSAFHAALVSTCGSPRLLQIRTILHEQTERYRRLELSVPHRDRDTDDEHRQLAEAAIARDVTAAARLMHDHINRTTEGIIRALSDSTLPTAPTVASPKRAATGSRASRGKAPLAAKAPATRRTATPSKRKSS